MAEAEKQQQAFEAQLAEQEVVQDGLPAALKDAWAPGEALLLNYLMGYLKKHSLKLFQRDYPMELLKLNQMLQEAVHPKKAGLSREVWGTLMTDQRKDS